MKNDKQILKFDPKNWDWYAFLNASKEVKERYYDKAEGLSEDWVTCACGQVCNMLPKVSNLHNIPLDVDARYLGYHFALQIDNKDWENAKITLDKIESRTIFLLQQPNYIDPKTL